MLNTVRRAVITAGCSLSVGLAFTVAAQAASVDPYLSIEHFHQQDTAGSTSSVQLARDYVARINRIDAAGPALHAVLALNPDLLRLAAQLDAAPASQRGPLQGVPVLLKDNINTGDHMPTTAGSLALAAAPAPADASIVRRLRAAGALLLGKANLSEWANFRSSRAISGWSGVGGQTRNPYVLDRSPCGSSAGSGAAVAAGLTLVAIGTETDGSIVCPSAMNGIVGIKPTLGLVSRAGIVPLSHSQDTAGPMARSVADAAAVLSVIAGSDPADPATAEADAHATDYTKFLDRNGLRGKRIGIVRALTGNDDGTDAVFEQTIAQMRAQGAVMVDDVEIPHLDEYGDDELTVLLYDFKHDINAYLATRQGLPVHSLADLIDYDKAHADREMPWFGQDLFIKAEAKGNLDEAEYREALARTKRLSGPEGIDAAMQAHRLDALLAPTYTPAFPIDPVLGDGRAAGASSPAAVSGYPSITVPAGQVHDLPVGVLFFGARWSEPKLIAMAYAFEQQRQAFTPPQFLPTVPVPAR